MTTFALTDSPEYREYHEATGLFLEARFLSLLETPHPSPGRPVITAAALRAVLSIELQVREVTIEVEKQDGSIVNVGFEDVCVRPTVGSPCQYVSAAGLLLGSHHGKAAVEQRLRQLEVMESKNTSFSERAAWLLAGVDPEMQALLPVVLGTGFARGFPGVGAHVARLCDWLSQVKVLVAKFDFLPGASSQKFELKAQQLLQDHSRLGGIRVTSMATGSLGQECAKSGTAAMPMLVVAIGTMICYVLIFLGAETRFSHGDTQLLLLLVGTSIPAISSVAAMGLLGYIGFSINVVVLMAPFLVLAVGVDDLFIMISSINSVGSHERNPSAVVGKALTRGGVAVTTSTMTSVAAFTASALTSLNFPGFLSFNLCLVFSLTLNWAGMLVGIPACVVLNEKRIAMGHFDLLPCCHRRRCKHRASRAHTPEPVLAHVMPQVQPAQEVDAEAAMQQGHGQVLGQELCLLSRWRLTRKGQSIISRYWAPMIEKNRSCHVIGAGLWLGMMIASAVLIPGRLEKGMPDRFFITDNSPLHDYLNDLELAFEKTVPLEVGLLLAQPKLGNSKYRQELRSFMLRQGQRQDAIMTPSCWPVAVAASLPSQAGSKDADAAVSAFFASEAGSKHKQDVVQSLNGSLVAARCRAFLWQPIDPGDRNAQAESLRAAAAGSSLPVVAYHSSFPVHVVRYRHIQSMTLQGVASACLAVFVSLLLVLPLHFALLAVTNVIAVVVALFGYMAAVGIACNALSYTVCIMAIGFCVDYTCHVMHFADRHFKADKDWPSCMASSLTECGFDILQGCATAFLGVMLLGFNPAEAFRIFASMSLFVTAVGCMFALWTLPSLLALLSCARDVKTRPKADASPCLGNAKPMTAMSDGDKGISLDSISLDDTQAGAMSAAELCIPDACECRTGTGGTKPSRTLISL
eukprot:TRINITY_DN16568_c0_g1_i1.p1 TRINITY_DN16568_c0_g1~~TRINITY_DN16568_c0_g1_i1.p1  ORF type:complete len:917 (-),score=130.15 TRINITY_DN16568_c0_g1_i1:85-2835(-)